MEHLPKIKKLFKKENLCIQNVYKAKENYPVIYINPKLYEEIYQEPYDWEKASIAISEKFSVTLNEEISNHQIVGKGYSDKQFDPLGISLNGNFGSGRAYFYDSIFNIKGDKTLLATSPNPLYSNGKHAMTAAIKDSITANILAEDFVIPSFQTLAILDTKEKYDFVDQYLDYDDTIKELSFHLPCCIEIRVYQDKELYRISNCFINGDIFTMDEMKDFCKKIASIEANKFCDRFLHGSWSAGNISTKGNMIDFDTATFVKGRYPQYSNTNKYPSNFFGYELIGQKMMIQSMLDFMKIKTSKQDEKKLFELIDLEYHKNLTIRFCDLIGLDYQKHYQKYHKYIDYLCEQFDTLSRKFVSNYYETNVIEPGGDSTFIFDFSRFFQRYLLEKEKHMITPMRGVKLLMNDTERMVYESVGMAKEKVEEFFYQDIVNEEDMDQCIVDAIDFVKEYDELFSKLEENELNEVKLKQLIINADREYIYANKNAYGAITQLYDQKRIDGDALNTIINGIIKSNLRNHFDMQKEHRMGLKLYQDFITYVIISKEYYYIVLEPFSAKKIEFAKLIVNGEERMMSHSIEHNIMLSEKIQYHQISDLLDLDVKIRINGKKYDKRIVF